MCVGSSRYFERHGTLRTPQELVNHNCIIFNGSAYWAFEGPQGKFSVRVDGNLSSNTVETILSAIQADVGIGMFYRATLAGELRDADIVSVLEDFIGEPRGASLIWPNRKFARVRQVTEFFAAALAKRI